MALRGDVNAATETTKNTVERTSFFVSTHLDELQVLLEVCNLHAERLLLNVRSFIVSNRRMVRNSLIKKITVFWDETPWRIQRSRGFRKNLLPPYSDVAISTTLKMEKTGSSNAANLCNQPINFKFRCPSDCSLIPTSHYNHMNTHKSNSRTQSSPLRSWQFLRQLNSPLFYRTHYCRVHKSLPTFLTLNQTNQVHTLPLYLLNIRFNIILSSRPKSSKWSLSFKWPGNR
jgi:hypothetical protein